MEKICKRWRCPVCGSFVEITDPYNPEPGEVCLECLKSRRVADIEDSESKLAKVIERFRGLYGIENGNTVFGVNLNVVKNIARAVLRIEEIVDIYETCDDSW